MEIEVIEEVTAQPPAFEISAAGGGRYHTVPVTWTELRDAEVGMSWAASEHGNLCGTDATATVVFREANRVVVLHESDYWQEGQERRISAQLKAYLI